MMVFQQSKSNRKSRAWGRMKRVFLNRYYGFVLVQTADLPPGQVPLPAVQQDYVSDRNPLYPAQMMEFFAFDYCCVGVFS